MSHRRTAAALQYEGPILNGREHERIITADQDDTKDARFVIAGVLTGVGLGTFLFVSPLMAILTVGAVILGVLVCLYPPLAGHVIVGVTPLIAGIDRGTLIPFFRPNEVLAILVGGALIARNVPRIVVDGFPRFRLRRSDLSILLLAATGSVFPLLWLELRGRAVTSDDFLHAITIW